MGGQLQDRHSACSASSRFSMCSCATQDFIGQLTPPALLTRSLAQLRYRLMALLRGSEAVANLTWASTKRPFSSSASRALW